MLRFMEYPAFAGASREGERETRPAGSSSSIETLPSSIETPSTSVSMSPLAGSTARSPAQQRELLERLLHENGSFSPTSALFWLPDHQVPEQKLPAAATGPDAVTTQVLLTKCKRCHLYACLQPPRRTS